MQGVGPSRRGRWARTVGTGVLATFLALAFPGAREGHEIPADVTVQAFVAPKGDSVRLVVRVPLTSMRDVQFPVRGQGYVDFPGVRPLLADQAGLWLADYVTLLEDGRPLPRVSVTATRISLPSDRSFRELDLALAHVQGTPLSDEIDLVLEQAMLDVVMTAPIASETARFAIDPQWAHLGIRTTTVVRFVSPSGTDRIFQFAGNPGLVRLDPQWYHAFSRFVSLGFFHILDGIDHLLFLLCLVIPIRRFWALVPVVTAFTVAHSITLAASVMGIAPNALWFPPLIETLIAASIVYMALENILKKDHRRRWMWAFGFGLVHGFGFSFALSETLQFAGSHLVSSLLAFNVGVEMGQLLVLLLVVPVLAAFFKRVSSTQIAQIVLSTLVAHTGWHWMSDRWARLLAFDLRAPALDAFLLLGVLRWTLLLLVVVAAAWALSGLYRRLAPYGSEPQDTSALEGADTAPAS